MKIMSATQYNITLVIIVMVMVMVVVVVVVVAAAAATIVRNDRSGSNKHSNGHTGSYHVSSGAW